MAMAAAGAAATFKSQANPDHISKEEWYMGIAILAAQRSKDPKTQVGATLVNADGIILSQGYNGMPTGCPDHAVRTRPLPCQPTPPTCHTAHHTRARSLSLPRARAPAPFVLWKPSPPLPPNDLRVVH